VATNLLHRQPDLPPSERLRSVTTSGSGVRPVVPMTAHLITRRSRLPLA
jgi:hypothetical protein